MASIIAIANQKGGVGKSTTSLAIADCLIRRKKKVLFVDTDPQRNSSSTYQAKIKDEATLYDLFFFSEDTTPQECIQHTPFGDIIASDEKLRDIDTKLPDNIQRYKYLKKALNKVKADYDYIIIDTPPHMGILLANVLMASDYLIVPVTCDFYASQGLYDFYGDVKMYQEDDNPNLKILGLLKVRYKGRQNLTQSIDEDILPDIAKQMNTKVFSTAIRESVKCQEAQMLQQRLFEYAPTCTSAQDYDEFVKKEIINKRI